MLNADEFIGPTQARQRLRLASMSNPIVHAVDMAARRDGLSDVDRYALMAYHLLQSADAFQRLALEQAQRAVPLGVQAVAPDAALQERYDFVLAACRDAQDIASRYGWALQDIAQGGADPASRARAALLGSDAAPAPIQHCEQCETPTVCTDFPMQRACGVKGLDDAQR